MKCKTNFWTGKHLTAALMIDFIEFTVRFKISSFFHTLRSFMVCRSGAGRGWGRIYWDWVRGQSGWSHIETRFVRGLEAIVHAYAVSCQSLTPHKDHKALHGFLARVPLLHQLRQELEERRPNVPAASRPDDCL